MTLREEVEQAIGQEKNSTLTRVRPHYWRIELNSCAVFVETHYSLGATISRPTPCCAAARVREGLWDRCLECKEKLDSVPGRDWIPGFRSPGAIDTVHSGPWIEWFSETYEEKYGVLEAELWARVFAVETFAHTIWASHE